MINSDKFQNNNFELPIAITPSEIELPAPFSFAVSTAAASSAAAAGSGSWIPPYPVSTPKPVYHRVDSLVSSVPVKGSGYTVIGQVNVRTLPSVYAPRATTIRRSGTTVKVLEEALNSAGQTWYAVKLQSGVLGYIRGDLLRVDIVYVNEEETAPHPVITPAPTPAAAVTPEVIYMLATPAPTPTPIIIYVQPDMLTTPAPEVTPEVIYITPEPTPVPPVSAPAVTRQPTAGASF